jgi:hypothetical protein
MPKAFHLLFRVSAIERERFATVADQRAAKIFLRQSYKKRIKLARNRSDSLRLKRPPQPRQKRRHSRLQ